MKALALGLALASCQPEAAPSIFVSKERGNVWYISPARARPMGIWMGDISTADINKFRRQYSPASQPICYLQQVKRSSFVGTDRAAQLEMEEDFKSLSQDPFHLSFATSDGRKFAARVGLAEECYSGAVGAILVIQDVGNGKIESVEWSSTPFLFLSRVQDSGWITSGDCLACDVYDVLVYDVKSRKFTWESE